MQQDPKGAEIIQFLAQRPSPASLEQYFKTIKEDYSRQLPYLIQNSDVFKQVSEWLKANLDTPYLSQIFKFVVRLYQLMGFQMAKDVSEYYRSHEKALARDPKFLSKSYLLGFEDQSSTEKLVDNPLLIFNLLHIAMSVIKQVVEKPGMNAYKPTLLVLLGFVSINCYDKNVKTIVRREKFFKNLIHIIKKLDKYQPNQQLVDNEIYVIVFEIFAKLTYKCPKNQEYFMKKSGYTQVKQLFKDSASDLAVMRPSLLTLTNCCDQNDYQIIFWSDGFVREIEDSANTHIRKAMESLRGDPKQMIRSLKQFEVAAIFLSRAASGCEEVVLDLLKSKHVIHHFEVLSRCLATCSPSQPEFQILLRCTATAASTICCLLEFSGHSSHLLSEVKETFYKLTKHFSEIDEQLEKHYQYLACLYANLLKATAFQETVSDEEAMTALQISMLYFVYSKTLTSGLGVLIKYSAQAPESLIEHDDLFILVLKVLEGYSYSQKTIYSVYAILCNLSIQQTFLEKSSQINIYKYSLVHLNSHCDSPKLALLIFRLLKYTLRNGLMIELFFRFYLELTSEIQDFNLLHIILKLHTENPQNEPLLLEMLSVLAVLLRNNKRFEQGLIANPDFIRFILSLTDEHQNQLSDEMVEVLAHYPLEDIFVHQQS